MINKLFADKFTLFIIIIFITMGVFYIKNTYLFERIIVKINKTAPRYIQNKFDYTIVLVGDSMTEYLGNLEELNYFLKTYYPDKSFLLLNYGYSSTNILSLPDRVSKDSFHIGRTFQAINDIHFDLLLIESFGNNPLSQYPLSEGLLKQNHALDQTLAILSKNHPRSSIAFIATIAPNKKYYGENFISLTPNARISWVNERSAYIKNHIDYAKSHQIPIIDILDNSYNIFGDGKLEYINPQDHIHPSTLGIFYIDDQISKYIYSNHLL